MGFFFFIGKTASLYWIDPWLFLVQNHIFLHKYFVSWFEFHRTLFRRVQLTISEHWLRWWLGAEQAPSHYLNQCWHSSLTLISGTSERWVLITKTSVALQTKFDSDSIYTQLNLSHMWSCGFLYTNVIFLNTPQRRERCYMYQYISWNVWPVSSWLMLSRIITWRQIGKGQ